jgi:hypothetical protein
MILPSLQMSSKSLLSIFQTVILLAAALFLSIHERRTSRIIKEMEFATYGWSEEWKVYNGQSKNATQQDNSAVRKLQLLFSAEIPQAGPKILWGITSAYKSDMELRRRLVIRSTYLSYYKNNDHFVDNPDRICSLADLREQKVHFDRCQLVYTFVMGGNPEGPEEFINPDAPSTHYLAEQSNINHSERDATYLNIKENQFGGKMQTWFGYASSLIKEGYKFDYIVKADSDTMLYPEEFFAEVNQSFPTNPTRIYAGVSVSRNHCGKKRDEHCNRMISDYYMGGSVEIVSADLVHYVTSLSRDQRRQLQVTNHEDITIGNFVLSHPESVTKLELSKPWGYKVRRRRLQVPVLWRHDKKTKQPGKLISKFYLYEKEIRRRDPSFDNIMVLPTSEFSEQLIKFAIKSACIHNRKFVVEYCAIGSFSGKTELYLSRMTTDIIAVSKIDGTSPLTFQLEKVEMFNYPVNDGTQAEEAVQEEEDDDETENDNEDRELPEKEEEEDNAVKKAQVQPWRENVVVAVRNPINDHLNEWFEVVQPNVPVDEMKTTSNNFGALNQLKKSNVKNIFVIRVEHIWEDILSLEKILRNPNPVDGADWPALTDPIIDVMSNSAHGKAVSRSMCCQLRHEIAAYYELLLLGQNLKDPSAGLLSSLQEISSMCGVASITDLNDHCKRDE